MQELESIQDDLCLSIYLPKVASKDTPSNQQYLMHIRNEVSDLLRWTQDPETARYFLDSIDELRETEQFSLNSDSHQAIFISRQGFQRQALQGKCPSFFALASSFHIKPLINESHLFRKFAVLRISHERATLFIGDRTHLEEVESVYFPFTIRPEFFAPSHPDANTEAAILEFYQDVADWIATWVSQALGRQKIPLLVFGIDNITQPFVKNAGLSGIQRKALDLSHEASIDEILAASNERIYELAIRDEKKALVQFNRAKSSGQSPTDLAEIAKQAARGNVATLIISADDQVWGELNRDTGDIRVHHEQASDIDDDLLDDIAELVLSQGGKVIVLDRYDMPELRSIAAAFKSAA